jgi:dTDP-4-dehydrorhamnose reductase
MGRHPSVVVTGAGGQVGVALQQLSPHHRYLAHDRLDVRSRDAVFAAITAADVVVHLAAMTHVDLCEAHPERAWAINATGTLNIVEAARRTGARVICTSTDYVFDGAKEDEYTETDEPRPLNIYGASKLAAERHVLADPDNVVIRTSWVFGRGRNFVRAILSAAERTDLVRVVDDQRGRPTSASDLARALEHVVVQGYVGVVNVAGAGRPCSWADLAERALKLAGISTRVERVTTEEYARGREEKIAPRPRNSALAIEKARTSGVPLGDWDRALRTYVCGSR